MMRLGTRGSPLALAQARLVAERLGPCGIAVEIVPIRTEGDRRLEARLSAVGGKGLFVREIEEALLANRIDAAVHSLKDLPAELPRGLALAAFPGREDPRDVLVTRAGGGLEDLPPAARVGTSSPRRRALALGLRPDLVIEALRGNVETRLRKLEREGLEAVILAAAGLARLGLSPPHVRPLDVAVFVPAVGQGVLALEARRDDSRTRRALEALDDPDTRVAATAERAFLGRLGASCNTPMAAHASLDDDGLRMTAVVVSEDGRRILRGQARGLRDNAEALGRGLAESLLTQGAASIVPLGPSATVAGAGRGGR